MQPYYTDIIFARQVTNVCQTGCYWNVWKYNTITIFSSDSCSDIQTNSCSHRDTKSSKRVVVAVSSPLLGFVVLTWLQDDWGVRITMAAPTILDLLKI